MSYIIFFLPKWMYYLTSKHQDHEQRDNQITGLGLPSFLLLGIGSVLNLCRNVFLQIRFDKSRKSVEKRRRGGMGCEEEETFIYESANLIFSEENGRKK